MRLLSLSLALALLIPIDGLSAQQPPIEPGARVWVTAPDCGLHKLVTTVEVSRDDTLMTLSTPTRSSHPGVNCPVASVTRLEVHGGKRSNWLPGRGGPV